MARTLDEFKGKPEEFRPPRGWSRPPFAENNTAAMKSGSWSPRVIEPLACEVLPEILEQIEAEGLSFLSGRPTFHIGLERTAIAYARLINEERYLDEHPEDEASAKRRDHFERSLGWWLNQMGLLPASRAKLQQALSVSAHNAVDLAAALNALEAEEGEAK